MYRRYFSEESAESEFIVWLDLPVGERKNGKLVGFEFTMGEHIWRKGVKDTAPAFFTKGLLFALAGKGVDAWEKKDEVPEHVVRRFREKLSELSDFLRSLNASSLVPPMPLDSSLRSE